MRYCKRDLENTVRTCLRRGKSVLLLGPRQTGKTTMLQRFKPDLAVTLAHTDQRRYYESDPARLRGEVLALRKRTPPLVILDEIQKVPQLLDEVQDLIDRRAAQFVLTGSSARKLRAAGVNLLPGRVVSLRMDPLSSGEFPSQSLEDHLLYGALPGIVSQTTDDRQTDLDSYVNGYLEEEIRQEALVRNVGGFSRFLELAAAESGLIVNCQELASKVGVSHTTIRAYYQILEDCLIAERIEPLSESPVRKRLTKSPRHLFFDLGVRRAAAREGTAPAPATRGFLFEQFVGLELLRHIRSHAMTSARLRFWRDHDGPEVDWIVERDGRFIPVEVKLTDNPSLSDARHLRVFMREYPTAGTGYIVCRVPRALQLAPDIRAVPWQSISTVFTD